MKKLFLGVAVFVVVLMGALIALPYFFKDSIVAQVKKAANENLTATLAFSDVDISVFRHFPQLSIGLEGLDITNGPGPFEGVKLVQCPRLDVTVDLWSAIFGTEVVIKGLFLTQPDIKVFVLSNGQANYDITKPAPAGDTPTSAEGSPIKLEAYGIVNGKILYDDRGLDMRAELAGLDHEGSGEFTSDLYDFVMVTHAQKLSVNYGGVQYLSNAQADWKATLGADMKNWKFTFKQNELKINALELMLDGWVQLPANTEDIRMDLTFGTPANTFKSFLSIVPGAYTKDFETMQANGTVKFSGFAKGTYHETSYPAFKLVFNIGNADFKYPSLPLGVSNINVDAAINSPTAQLNDMTVNIPKFSLKIGSNPLEGYFNLKTLETDPTIDTKINGTLNLAELSKAFPMEGVQELSGIIKANITMKAAMSQMDAQQYDRVNMAGDFSMSGITYRSSGMPTVKINALTTGITPQKIDIQQFDAKLGNSDLRASGSVDNILAYFSTTKTMRGSLNFASNYVDVQEWTEPTPEDGAVVPNDVAPTVASEKVFDRWDFSMDGKIGALKYDTYTITALTASGHFTPNKMDITNFGFVLGKNSDLRGSGQILNAWNYLFDNQTIKGVVNLNSAYFDLNQFMETPVAATGATAVAAPASIIPVPAQMDMTLHADFDKIRYTTYDLSNLTGQVVVKDEVAKLEDCTAEIMGGQVALSGDYNTQNPSKPTFNMDMALQNMGFRDAFETFSTAKTLAPIMQYIDGKFNTTLSMSGILGTDMMPDFNTFSAAGFLETIHAIFNNFKPANLLGEKLGIDYLKKMELTDTKNWFEIKDGKITVKPFNTKIRDVSMQIGGTYGLNSEMDYQIITKTPRSALEKSGLGTAANTGLNLLSKEASKAGINLAQGEFINVRFDLTGSIASPKIAMKILASDGQSTLKEAATGAATAVVEKAKDSLTNVANRELDKVKDKAKAAADKAADSLKTLADKKIKEATDKITQEAKDKLGKEVGEKIGDKVGQKAGEVLGDKGQKKVDEVKDKLDKWDPFKKKKKDN
jgi:hypothetical protein